MQVLQLLPDRVLLVFHCLYPEHNKEFWPGVDFLQWLHPIEPQFPLIFKARKSCPFAITVGASIVSASYLRATAKVSRVSNYYICLRNFSHHPSVAASLWICLLSRLDMRISFNLFIFLFNIIFTPFLLIFVLYH